MAIKKRKIFKNISLTSQKEVLTIKDIEDILHLNEAHWTTTGVSVDAINCDPAFLNYLDIDKNMRIMCFEVKAAIQWLFTNLRDKQGIINSSIVLRLDAIDTNQKEGQALAISASQALNLLGKNNGKELSLEEVRKLKSEIEQTPISGAGVVLPDAAEAPPIREFLTDILNTTGGVPHPAGRMGVNTEKMEEFIQQSNAYLTWFCKSQASGNDRNFCHSFNTSAGENQGATVIKPLGEATDKAFIILQKLKEKINEYFVQCRLAAHKLRFEPPASTDKQIEDEEASLHRIPDTANLEDISHFLLKAPLARPDPERILYFEKYINCYYEEDIHTLLTDLIHPFLGSTKKTLTEKEWQYILDSFQAYAQWQAEKTGESVASVGITRLQNYLSGNYTQTVLQMIEISRENALVLDETRYLEKLILFQAFIIKFLNNFVYFPYLYDPGRRALFEMGTLIMDGRIFTLSVKVDDHSRHIDFARKSNMFILYVHVLSAASIKYEVAVPVTHGRKGNLYIGKRGIFQDINGNDWDAIVIDIIENPISLTEAIATPFQKFTKLLTSKIEELKHAAETKLNTVVKETKIAPALPAPAQAPATSQGIGNLFMGSSIAIAALGSALAFITKTISEVKWYTLVMTIAGAFVVVLLPTFITAFNKLRKRDLAAILEASGWAVNVRMNLTLKLGKFFTQKPPQSGLIRKFSGLRRFIVISVVILLILLLLCFHKELAMFFSTFKV